MSHCSIESPTAAQAPIEHCGLADEVVAWEVQLLPTLTLPNLLLLVRLAIKSLHHTPSTPPYALKYRLTLLLLLKPLKRPRKHHLVAK